MSFDDIRSHLAFGAHPDFDLAEYTLEVWFRLDEMPEESEAFTTGAFLIARGENPLGAQPAGDVIQYSLGINADGQLRAWYETADEDSDVFLFSQRRVSLGFWHHGAVTRDASGAFRLYMDGVEVAVREDTPQPARINFPVYIGARSSGGGQPVYHFPGVIQEARIWSVALEPEVLQSCRERQLVDGTPGLVIAIRTEGEEIRVISAGDYGGFGRNAPVVIAEGRGCTGCSRVPAEPVQEACNGLDDDCDDAVDEGAVCPISRLFGGAGFGCAIRSERYVSCWGEPRISGSHARLDGGVVDGCGGTSHACVLSAAGQVTCWGRNLYGELGSGEPDSTGFPIAGRPARHVNLGLNARAKSLSCGESSTCVILQDGRVKCWGRHPTLEPGQENTVGDEPGEMGDALPAVELGGAAVRVAVGSLFWCALMADGSVKCWGGGNWAQLGRPMGGIVGDEPGEMGDALAPIPLGGAQRAVDVTLASHSGFARLEDGTWRCWGRNYWGRAGLGHSNQLNEPTPCLPGLAATKVTTGYADNCLLDAEGRVKCWGRNNLGAAGLEREGVVGDEEGERVEMLPWVDLGPEVEAVRDITSNSDYSCAQVSEFTVKCWGNGIGDEPGEMGEALDSFDP